MTTSLLGDDCFGQCLLYCILRRFPTTAHQPERGDENRVLDPDELDQHALAVVHADPSFEYSDAHRLQRHRSGPFG